MRNYLCDMIIHNVIACNRIYLKKGVSFSRKNRDHTAVTIKTQGLTKYFQNEKTFISDSNHICILPTGSDYSYLGIEEGECLMIELDTPAICGEILSIPVSSLDDFIALFLRLEHTLSFEGEYKRISLLSNGYRLLEKLLEQAYKAYSSPRDTLLLSPAIKYIEENLTSSTPENAFLASLCNVSTVYFRKLFIKKCGMPPTKYITHLKIQKAKGLIISDYSSLSDVAEATGFSNIHYFSKTFKAVTGLTPTEFKRQENKKE